MNANLLKWSTAIGAFDRILAYKSRLGGIQSYFERLRVVNDVLGPHWVFRLADEVGIETIRENRYSWYEYYVLDADDAHCPLDPGAPETESYLGKAYSDMDLAFYAGMGFDGYRLALQTQRKVDLSSKIMEFDGRYKFEPTFEMQNQLEVYDKKRFIPKEEYYASYAATLSSLYSALNGIIKTGKFDYHALETVAAACLIVMCGGHKGCKLHKNDEDRFNAQMESLVIFGYTNDLLAGKFVLEDCIMRQSLAI